MPERYKVKVASKAKEMFAEHVTFLRCASLNAAQRLVLSYKKSIARIADNPFQFPIADELDVQGILPNAYRKCLFEERYKILFWLEEREVFVVAVIDTRMENKDLDLSGGRSKHWDE